MGFDQDLKGGATTANQGTGQRAIIACAAGASVAAVFLIFWYAIDVLLLVFAGVLFSVVLEGLASRLSGMLGLGYKVSFGIVVIALFASAGLLVWYSGDRLSVELDQLAERIPEAASQLRNRLERYDWIERTLKDAPGPEQFLRDRPELLTRATGFVSTTFSALTSCFVVLFIGLYLGLDPQLYRRGFLRLIPPQRREGAGNVLRELGDTLWWWAIAHFGAMAVVGLLTMIGLWLIGIPLAFVLGVIAAVFAFIPNIGPVLSAIPAILIAFSESPEKVLYVLLLYLAVQAVESNLISPVFQQKASSLPPALTIAVQLLLGTLAGMLGLLMASPLLAAVLVLVGMLYIEDWLGERGAAEGDASV